jgi:hypothetical protein
MASTHISLTIEDGQLYLVAPYDEDANEDYRGAGGRWDRPRRAWAFPAAARPRLAQVLAARFGYQDIDADVAPCAVHAVEGPAALWCWGSVRSPAGADPAGPLWTPLAAEMLAAATVMLYLWERRPAHWRAELTAGLGLEEEGPARVGWALLAGVSRVGEANPARMAGFDGDRHQRAPWWSAAHRDWRRGASDAGLPLPPGDKTYPYRAEPQHITAATLPRLLGCDCQGVANGEQCRAHRHLHNLALAVNEHEFGALHYGAVNAAHGAAEARWDGIRAQLVAMVADHVGAGLDTLPDLFRAPTHATTAGSRAVAEANADVRRALAQAPGVHFTVQAFSANERAQWVHVLATAAARPA